MFLKDIQRELENTTNLAFINFWNFEYWFLLSDRGAYSFIFIFLQENGCLNKIIKTYAKDVVWLSIMQPPRKSIANIFKLILHFQEVNISWLLNIQNSTSS